MEYKSSITDLGNFMHTILVPSIHCVIASVNSLSNRRNLRILTYN